VRRRHARLKAWLKRRGEIEVTKKWWRPTTDRATRIMDAAGRSVIRAATTRAMGL
jgi:hypothetical protein